MPRFHRPDFTSTYHHVIVRGVDGLPIFDTARKKQKYIDLMIEARKEHDLSVYAIGFLNNHVHQFVRRNKHSMGVFYRRLNGRYGLWYNTEFKRTGALYDSRYYSTMVDSEVYFQAVWRYTHNQGVKAGLYDSVEEDPWSSARVYLGLSSCFEWIDWKEAVEELEIQPDRELKDVLQKVGEQRDWYGKENFPYEIYRGQKFLAEEAFIEQYMQIREEKIRSSQRNESPYEWKTLLKTAREISELSKQELVEPSQNPKRVRHRSGFAYACRSFGHMSLSEIAAHLNVSESAVSKMIKRVREQDPELRKRWESELSGQ
ncbi:MAG: transposase [bacterium]